jgi:hypothetical protein
MKRTDGGGCGQHRAASDSGAWLLGPRVRGRVRHLCGNPICLSLVLVPRISENEPRTEPSVRLLKDVSQLVCQELLSAGTAGLVGSLTEEDVPARGECHGVDRAIQPVCLGIGMHSDSAKVRTERGFHDGARHTVERLPSPAGALDGRFHFRENLPTITTADDGQGALDIAVTVEALRLQDRVRRARRAVTGVALPRAR